MVIAPELRLKTVGFFAPSVIGIVKDDALFPAVGEVIGLTEFLIAWDITLTAHAPCCSTSDIA